MVEPALDLRARQVPKQDWSIRENSDFISIPGISRSNSLQLLVAEKV